MPAHVKRSGPAWVDLPERLQSKRFPRFSQAQLPARPLRFGRRAAPGGPSRLPVPGIKRPPFGTCDLNSVVSGTGTSIFQPMIRRCFGPVGLSLGLVLGGSGCLHDSNAPGARPTKLIDLGPVGASEGPAWHPSGYLLFTGGGHISKRTAQGELSIFRADSGGANGLLFD